MENNKEFPQKVKNKTAGLSGNLTCECIENEVRVMKQYHTLRYIAALFLISKHGSNVSFQPQKDENPAVFNNLDGY